MNPDAYKIVLIGDAGVGKTSISNWLIHKKHDPRISTTIGAAFLIKEMTLPVKNEEGKDCEAKIKFHIWDTAGQERFRSIVKMYYRNTVGCLCVFDLTNRNSFLHLAKWIEDYRGYVVDTEYTLLIVGNKADHPESRWRMTIGEINDFALENKCQCVLTNCITGSGINEAFEIIGKSIIQKHGPPIGTEYKVNEKCSSISTIVSLARRPVSPMIPSWLKC